VVTDFAGVVARLVPATATDWWALPTPTSAKADAIGHGSVTSSNFTSNPADPNGDFPPVGAVNASSQPVCTKFTITADYPAHETFLTGLAGNATHAEEAAYSTAVDTWAAGAHNTFNDFKATYGFPAGEASAVYFNNADLKLGRDMHCRTATGGVIACYVSNYLDNVTPPAGAAAALQATAKGHEGTSTNLLFATVAMVWDPGKPADVSTQFFVYPADPNGPRVTEAQLDDEGPKPVPQICTPCHGGSFEASDNLAHGSRFLPFDIASFVMVDDEFGAAGASALGLDAYTRPNQLGQFRALNALVRQTETGRGISPDPVTDLIDNWYSVCGGVNNSACNTCSGANCANSFNADYVPSGWSGATDVYTHVVRPMCRGCHINQPSFDWTQLSQFTGPFKGSISNDVCVGAGANHQRRMPHAEVPFKAFWQSPVAPGLLTSAPVSIASCTR